MAEKQFNTAGPSKPELHYLLDPLERVDLQEIEALVEAQRPQAFPQTVVLCGVREQRVHRVISRLLAGEQPDDTLPTDDVEYVVDLGLITTRPQLRIANRIYREVIPRELTWTRQITIAHEQAWYLTPERRLDMPKLLAAFQQFFRENADAWIERFQYRKLAHSCCCRRFCSASSTAVGASAASMAWGGGAPTS